MTRSTSLSNRCSPGSRPAQLAATRKLNRHAVMEHKAETRLSAVRALLLVSRRYFELVQATVRGRGGSSSWQAPTMAFKLTYSDGQADDYDDNTKWELEA
jgi:hypothetical protein